MINARSAVLQVTHSIGSKLLGPPQRLAHSSASNDGKPLMQDVTSPGLVAAIAARDGGSKTNIQVGQLHKSLESLRGNSSGMRCPLRLQERSHRQSNGARISTVNACGLQQLLPAERKLPQVHPDKTQRTSKYDHWRNR